MNQSFSDQEILANVNKGGKAFEDISLYLFHQYKGFISTIQSKLHLPQEQMQDAYADALVKLLRHLKNGQFRGDSKISSYFYRIFYNTCVDVSRKNTSNKNMPTQELFEYDAKETDLRYLIDIKDEAQQVLKLIESLGDTCKRILIDWGYYGYQMDEIASRNNLSNAESARSMKYKCLKKLKDILNKADLRK